MVHDLPIMVDINLGINYGNPLLFLICIPAICGYRIIGYLAKKEIGSYYL